MPKSFFLRTTLILIACLTAPLFAMSSFTAQKSPEDVVQLWIKQSLRVDTFRITWYEGVEVKGPDGEIMEAFDMRRFCEYRWPIEMRIETRAIPTGHRHDAARAANMDRVSQIDATGEYIKTPIHASNSRSLGKDRSLQGIVRTQSLYAPHLIGIWLADHPEIASTALRNADNTVSITIEQLRLRVMLSENPDANGNLHPVVSRLESLDKDLYPSIWWVFDDFQPIGNAELWGGQFRIQYSASTGTLYESPPARVEEIEMLAKRPATSGSINHASGDDASVNPDSASTQQDTDDQSTDQITNQSSKEKPMIFIVLGLLGVGIAAVVLVLRSKQ